LIGDAADYDLAQPADGVWGLRVYTRLADARHDRDSEPFPATHYWASAGEPAYEHLRWADGREVEHGDGGTAGELFAVRGVEGPDAYPSTGEWSYEFRGDWDG
jgi:hypothetical protein